MPDDDRDFDYQFKSTLASKAAAKEYLQGKAKRSGKIRKRRRGFFTQKLDKTIEDSKFYEVIDFFNTSLKDRDLNLAAHNFMKNLKSEVPEIGDAIMEKIREFWRSKL